MMDAEIYSDEYLLAELHSLKKSMNRIADFILEMKRDYSVLDEKIELNSADVMRLLGISRASLARCVMPVQYPSDMYRVTMWSIRSKSCISLLRQDELPSKAFDVSRPCNDSMPTKTASRKATWVTRKSHLRNYEHQGRDSTTHQQGVGHFLLLYAHRLCPQAQLPEPSI